MFSNWYSLVFRLHMGFFVKHLCDHIPSAPRIHQLLWTISILAGDHLVVPTGVSRISLWLQEIQSREWEKRTKNKRTIWAWVNSNARRLSCNTVHSLCICRLSLAWNFSEIFYKATRNANSSWLVFPHCCWTLSHVTSLSDVRCRLPTAPLRRPSPTPLSLSLSSFPNSCLAFPCLLPVELRPLFGFAPKQTKGSSA